MKLDSLVGSHMDGHSWCLQVMSNDSVELADVWLDVDDVSVGVTICHGDDVERC